MSGNGGYQRSATKRQGSKIHLRLEQRQAPVEAGEVRLEYLYRKWYQNS